jgi:hypothetical protein
MRRADCHEQEATLKEEAIRWLMGKRGHEGKGKDMNFYHAEEQIRATFSRTTCLNPPWPWP